LKQERGRNQQRRGPRDAPPQPAKGGLAWSVHFWLVEQFSLFKKINRVAQSGHGALGSWPHAGGAVPKPSKPDIGGSCPTVLQSARGGGAAKKFTQPVFAAQIKGG